MEFRALLISDIYADAFSFPIICRRLAEETQTLTHFHEMELFRNCRVKFLGPLPQLHQSNVVEIFQDACEIFVDQNLEIGTDDRQLRVEEVRCRFIMFELMLVWTFFHELGHVVQGHQYMDAEGRSLMWNGCYLEMDDEALKQIKLPVEDGIASEAISNSMPDLAAQALELMADADATDQTLKYLVMRRRLNFNVWYLLLCSTGCMFQRFYTVYPDNLELSHARHPHPAIRDEASQLLSLNWVADYLVANKNVQTQAEAVLPLTYLNVRASLVTGLFRSHRMEKREGADRLPSYMGLVGKGNEQQRAYLQALLPEIERQLPVALQHHLIDLHSIKYWFEHMKASVNAIGASHMPGC
ncbi:hypothetical protein CSQ96_21345 [Janthinobacterium sp. BJB412]|nr:hypothetical protein CSQ96_21345 [Janthinobacterium sp. BJB412]